MPDLKQTLRSTDLDFLQRVARSWKIELKAQKFQSALDELLLFIHEKSNFDEVLSFLPENARAAWQYLIDHQGRESWAIFTRLFGELRSLGAARRDRENPDINPISAVEMLWYRGLIGRAFLKIVDLQEYAYIPDDYLAMLRPENSPSILPALRPASEQDHQRVTRTNDRILDDLTEALASLRMNRLLADSFIPQNAAYHQFLLALMSKAALISSNQQPEPDQIKRFFSSSRDQALLDLFNLWYSSSEINELRLLPGLVFEGNWTNDPLLPRKLVIDLLTDLSSSTWWSISSLVHHFKTDNPDFQRPAGDYDSWFIREEKSNQYLRGFENWDRIEGALLQFLVAGPLHWLGVVEIGRGEKNSRPLAFRLSAPGQAMLKNQLPNPVSPESGCVTALPEAILLIPRDVPRSMRYQLERFCVPVKGDKSETKYRITSGSLFEAANQQLRPTQLIQLLRQTKTKNIPSSLIEMLENWEKFGPQVHAESVLLLRLDKEELLPRLQKNLQIARCLGEVLNPFTVVVKPGSQDSLRQALIKIGLLGDFKIDSDV